MVVDPVDSPPYPALFRSGILVLKEILPVESERVFVQ